MSKIISIVNQKGGVGKTTTAINLAYSLVHSKHKVLVIDTDSSVNATIGLGISKDKIKTTLYDCLFKGVDIHESIMKSNIDKLDVISVDPNVDNINIELFKQDDRESFLKKTLSSIKDDYDFIIIDCPPTLNLVTINALVASNSVLIPVQCEYFSMIGVGNILNTIKIIQNNLNPYLGIEGFLLNMYDSTSSLSKVVLNEVNTHFKGIVLSTVIDRDPQISEALCNNKPVMMFDKTSVGATKYMDLTKEILSHK